MNKYLDIIDQKTFAIGVICIFSTWFSLKYNFSYDLDLIIFSIAIIFPLVFTIREAFKRRENAIKLLSIFKSSVSAIFFSLENSSKLSVDEKREAHSLLNTLSRVFIEGLQSTDNSNIREVREEIRNVYYFVDTRKNSISSATSLKLIRFMKDMQASIENLNGIKTHGTPVSLRAYCLIFIFILPLIYTPTLVYYLAGHSAWLVYVMSLLHGFIMISLYNLQEHIEDPFDQLGLDDIHLLEFQFREDDEPRELQPANQP